MSSINAPVPFRTVKILILEDVPEDVRLMRRELEIAGYKVKVRVADDESSFTLGLMHFWPDIILADYNLPYFSGLDALLIAREKSPTTPFIFVTGSVGEEIAAETIVSGASGFVLKSNLGKLIYLLDKLFQQDDGLQNRQLEYTNRRVQARIEENIKSLEKIHAFLEKSGNQDAEWQDAMHNLKLLKSELEQKEDLSVKD